MLFVVIMYAFLVHKVYRLFSDINEKPGELRVLHNALEALELHMLAMGCGEIYPQQHTRLGVSEMTVCVLIVSVLWKTYATVGSNTR